MQNVTAPTVASFDALNAAQSRAACYGNTDQPGRSGPLLVIAGAGTGKTMTLSHRVAHLVMSGIAGERILLLTFSRRAAVEMGRRTRRIVRDACPQAQAAARLPWSGTFHSVANRLLRQYAHHLGLDVSFSILDRGDAADLMDVVRHTHGLSAKSRRFPRKDTCLAIYSRRVNTGDSLADTLQHHYPWCADWETELTSLFRAYVLAKQEASLLDYDDLLLYWHYLMEEPALAAAVGRRFDHVLVDEYQDTNTLQARILARMKPDGAGVTVVGDDAQSIYSFRAANVENILRFPDSFTPPAAVIRLEHNYRSTQPVLDLANRLMEGADDRYAKELRSNRGSGQKPRLVTVDDDAAQARFVVTSVLERREQGVLLKSQAVLFRSGHHSDLLEVELVQRGIPYVKYGGLKFLEAAHVKDLLSVLRWAENPRNRVAGFRVLQLMSGVGPAIAAKAFDTLKVDGHRFAALSHCAVPAAARSQWHALVRMLLAMSETHAPWQGQVRQAADWYRPLLDAKYAVVEPRSGDLEQLEQLSARFASREQFLSELTLDPPQASGDLAGDPLLDEDYLVLSTVHSAKGQEWDSVHVLNVADGNFPSEFATGNPALLEEERRLLYVAITRAKNELNLVCPLKYYVTGQPRHGARHVYGARSRFITKHVLGSLQCIAWPPPSASAMTVDTPAGHALDVAARVRDMW